MKKLILILAVAAINVQAFAADGIKIVSTTKNLANGSMSNTNIYMTENQIVLENKGGKDNGSFIFNSVKEEFTYVDHIKKEYYYFDKATMQKLKQQIQMMLMMMKQFAANMPEEQKKKLDKVMNKDASRMKFIDTGSSAKIGQWSAKKYEGLTKDEKTTEMYIATFKTVGFNKDQFQIMDKLMNYFNTNLSDVAAFLPAGGSFSQFSFDDSSPVFKEGVPVKTVSYVGDQATNENIVKSIQKESFSDAIFKAPSGYARKQINMQMK